MLRSLYFNIIVSPLLILGQVQVVPLTIGGYITTLTIPQSLVTIPQSAPVTIIINPTPLASAQGSGTIEPPAVASSAAALSSQIARQTINDFTNIPPYRPVASTPVNSATLNAASILSSALQTFSTPSPVVVNSAAPSLASINAATILSSALETFSAIPTPAASSIASYNAASVLSSAVNTFTLVTGATRPSAVPYNAASVLSSAVQTFPTTLTVAVTPVSRAVSVASSPISSAIPPASINAASVLSSALQTFPSALSSATVPIVTIPSSTSTVVVTPESISTTPSSTITIVVAPSPRTTVTVSPLSSATPPTSATVPSGYTIVPVIGGTGSTTEPISLASTTPTATITSTVTSTQVTKALASTNSLGQTIGAGGIGQTSRTPRLSSTPTSGAGAISSLQSRASSLSSVISMETSMLASSANGFNDMTTTGVMLASTTAAPPASMAGNGAMPSRLPLGMGSLAAGLLAFAAL